MWRWGRRVSGEAIKFWCRSRKKWQEEIKLGRLSAECRYGVVFPVGAGANQLKKKKMKLNPPEKEQKHTLKNVLC